MERNQVTVEETKQVNSSKALGIVSFITGIAVLFCPLPLNIVSFVLSLIFSRKSENTAGEYMGQIGKKFAIACLIIRIIINIILGIILTILLISIILWDLLTSGKLAGIYYY